MKIRRMFDLCSDCVDVHELGNARGADDGLTAERFAKIKTGLNRYFGNDSFIALSVGSILADETTCDCCGEVRPALMCIALFRHVATPRFKLGRVVATRQASAILEHRLQKLLDRHVTGDWGGLCCEDWNANERALEQGDRILSKYGIDDCDFYVVTERDRSYTTIMLCNEY